MSINFTFVKLFSHKIDIPDKETITLSASEPSNLINSKNIIESANSNSPTY